MILLIPLIAVYCSLGDTTQSTASSHCVSHIQWYCPRVLGLTLQSEKIELSEEAHRIIKTIKQMEASLEDPKLNNTYQLDDKDLKVTAPLIQCLQNLKEKYNSIAKIHRERFEQVKSQSCHLL